MRKIKSLPEKLNISEERFKKMKADYPKVTQWLEKMQIHEKIFIQIEEKLNQKSQVEANGKTLYEYCTKKLDSYGNQNIQRTGDFKVATYEKYDEKLTNLEYNLNNISIRIMPGIVISKYKSQIKFMQDLHPDFREKRLHKHDEARALKNQIYVKYDELENGKKFIYTSDNKKIELTPKLEKTIQTLIKKSFSQQELLETVFDFQLHQKLERENAIFKKLEKSIQTKQLTKEAMQRASSHCFYIPTFDSLDENSKNKVQNYAKEQKCSIQDAIFELFC